MKRELLNGLAASALSLAACASAPPPNDQLASAEAAVRASHEVGADRTPQAQLHQRLAEEQIGRARKLMQDGDNRRAELMLQRAKADAELSVALARDGAARERLGDSPQSAEPQAGAGER